MLSKLLQCFWIDKNGLRLCKVAEDEEEEGRVNNEDEEDEDDLMGRVHCIGLMLPLLVFIQDRVKGAKDNLPDYAEVIQASFRQSLPTEKIFSPG